MEQKKINELGIAGMVLGIIAVILSCVMVGGVLGIIGLCLSIAAKTQKEKSSGSAVAGIILNSVSIILAVVTLFIVVISFSETKNDVKTFPIGTEDLEVISPATNSQEVPEIPTVPLPPVEGESTKTSNLICTVGNAIENSMWKISFLDVKLYDSINSEYYKDEPKEDGNKFLVLFFEVENVSSKDQYFNCYDFDAYLDGYATDIVFTFNEPEGYKELSDTVAKGMKLRGCITYEVPEKWDEVSITYQEFLNVDKLEFRVNRTDIK